MNNDNSDEVKIDLDADLNEDLDIELDNDEDDIVSEEEMENPKGMLKKLKDEIKQLKQEKSDLLTNWQKDKAEFINARKRDEETKADVIKFSNQMLIADLLPIIDGYEQAKMQPTWTGVDEAWRKGIEAIIDKVYASLQKTGVESYGKVGDVFDPKIYEALGQEVTSEGLKDNTVSMIMQKGYKLHDKVIRPALVKVYHFE
jgi:molecular chaperone GrpE